MKTITRKLLELGMKRIFKIVRWTCSIFNDL